MSDPLTGSLIIHFLVYLLIHLLTFSLPFSFILSFAHLVVVKSGKDYFSGILYVWKA